MSSELKMLSITSPRAARTAPVAGPEAARAAQASAERPPVAGGGESLPVRAAESPPPSARVQEALGEIRQQVQRLQRSLEFSLDEDSGRTVIKVLDTETREVIRQIPAEEVLAIASRIQSAAGLLVEDTV